MRVLIVLPGAIGDVVRALPLLGRLRRGWPDAVLGWSVEPPSAPLLVGHPWIDRVHVFDRRRGVRGMLAHVRALRGVGYDLGIDLGRSAKSALISLGSGTRRRLGFARADTREGGWLTSTERLPAQPVERAKLEQFLAFGDALGLPAAPMEFGLAATAEERARVAAFLPEAAEPILALPLGSSCPSRRWLPERTAALVDAIDRTRSVRAALLGTPADGDFARAVAGATTARVVDLTGRTTLRDLIAVFERSRAVVGPDSGALHLAAAVGRPVVSLWGATSPLRSAPYGSEARTVAGRAPCAPCFLTTCPIGRVCMRTIEVDEVRALVEQALAA
jgi:lipopolysaccharide heptosyltransferase II